MIMRKKERTNKNILNKNNHLIYKKKIKLHNKNKVLSKIIEIKKNKNSKIKKIKKYKTHYYIIFL